MSEFTSTPVAHEAYAFACMRCGHGWEQEYDIERHAAPAGREFVVYRTGGKRVPSPLSRPTCVNCGAHVVRIMRAGQVSSVLGLMGRPEPHGATRRSAAPAAPAAPAAGPDGREREGPPAGSTMAGGPVPEPRHRRLSELLHAFHRR